MTGTDREIVADGSRFPQKLSLASQLSDQPRGSAQLVASAQSDGGAALLYCIQLATVLLDGL